MRQGIYQLTGNLQDLDFSMFLGQGIEHDLYDSYLLSVIYLFSELSVCHFRFTFIYLFIYLFISGKYSPKLLDSVKKEQLKKQQKQLLI